MKAAGVAVALGFAACGGQVEDDFPPSVSGGLGGNGAFPPPLGAVGSAAAAGSSARGGTGSSLCLGSVCGGAGGVSFGAGGNTSFAAGGATAVAGAGGVGGTTGVIGTGGSGFVPDPVSTLYAFDSGLDGFRVRYFCSSPSMCATVFISPDDDPDATVVTSFVSWGLELDEGFQGPGAARLGILFNGAGGLVDFARDVASVDLTNKRLTAEVQLESGSIVTAKLYLKTGQSYVYGDAGPVTLVAEQWVQLSFPTIGSGFTQPGFDISDVREIGIELATAVPTTQPAIVLIDRVAY